MATAVSLDLICICQQTLSHTFVLAAANPVPAHAGFAGVLFAVFFDHVVWSRFIVGGVVEVSIVCDQGRCRER